MGAQESSLRSKADTVEIGEEYSKKSDAYRIWTHIHPCTKNRKLRGTVFTKEYGIDSDEKIFFENGVKLLKQLRHPGIISFLENTTTPAGLTLITERVQILDLCIDSLSSVEIHSGLRQILEVLVFLHEKAGISHNNICPSCIFVTPSGEWKLGGFEFAHHFATSRQFTQSEFYARTKLEDFSLPETQANDPSSLKDAFGFGKLVEYALGFIEDDETDDEIVEALRSMVKSLTTINSNGSRPALRDLLTDFAFNNHLTLIADFLHKVHLKSDDDKNEFYGLVIDRLRSLPPRVVARRLCRLALSRYVLLEPRSHSVLYPVFLTPAGESEEISSESGLFPVELFRTFIVPEIVRIFAVRETSIRLGILNHFHRYAKYIPMNQLDEFILEEVCLSAHDVDDRLVASSLQAMACLVPILGGERVCGWRCVKSFVDGTPKVDSVRQSHVRTATSLPHPQEVISHKTNYITEEEGVLSSTSQLPLEDVIEDENLSVAPPEDTVAAIECWKDETEWSNEWDDDEEEKEDEDPVLEMEPEGGTESFLMANEKRVDQQATYLPSTNLMSRKAAEYEIPVVKKEEEDFFADMMPEIKTSGSIIDRLMAIQEEQQKSSKATPAANKFAMCSEEMEDTGGWGGEEEADIWDEDGTSIPKSGLEDGTTFPLSTAHIDVPCVSVGSPSSSNEHQ